MQFRHVGLSALAVAALLASCGKSNGGGDGDRGATGGNGATAGHGAVASSGTAGSSSAGRRANQGGAAGSGAAPSSGGSAATDAAGTGDGSSAGGSTPATGGSSAHAGGSSAQGGEGGLAEAGTGNASHGGENGGGSVPLTLFIMFDRSWSMRQCGDGNPSSETGSSIDCATLSRWDLTSQALLQFVQDPAAAGLLVALRFFPDDRPAQGCDGYLVSPASGGFGMGGMDGGLPPFDAGGELNCDVGACGEPLVREAALTAEPAPADVQEAALVTAIQSSEPPGPELPNPNAGTPTSAALGGAEQWALAYSAGRKDQQTAVVLVTDGEATGCDTDNTHIAALAATAKDGGVLTYVVGLSGSSETALNQIAVAGGTGQAFFVKDGSTVVADLLAALTAIRQGHP